MRRLATLLLLGGAMGACDDTEPAAAPVVDAGAPDMELPDDPLPSCRPTPEICNGVDDDCDGFVDDEDPDLALALFEDTEHCGACFSACQADRAQLACQAGVCIIVSCDPGFGDYNGQLEDGCETDCVLTAGGVERCDDVDNDCDGLTDEAFDFMTDVENCGGCGVQCPTPVGATSTCEDGVCQPMVCAPGRVDLDGDEATGCEYRCLASEQDGEQCNGLDDDCDGEIDESVDLAPPPPALCPTEGVCGDECRADRDCEAGPCLDGVCQPADAAFQTVNCVSDAECQAVHPGLACLEFFGVTPSERRCAPRRHRGNCDGSAGYRCVYGPDRTIANELGACDGLDNDCDGRTDEDFAGQLLTADRRDPLTCAAGLGICRAEGEMRCSDDGQGVVCGASARPDVGIDDSCDGVDQDCDGRVDEHFEDALITVGDVQIYAFEASRAGAFADDPGPRIAGRACSRPGVLPWTDVSWLEAAEACAAAGARLCTEAEWALACGGAAGEAYPYGAQYNPATCNGGQSPWDGVQPGGVAGGCQRGGVFDLSGNVKEWVHGGGFELRPVRGGGYESALAAGLTCGQDADLKVPDFRHPAIGFRCCKPAEERP